jgi:hypothetical protein
MNTQIANGKCFINNKPIDYKYSIKLLTNINEIRFIVTQFDPPIEVFSCDYKNVIIDNRNPDVLVINAPNFYGEFSVDNCIDISYTNLISGLSTSTKLIIKNEVLVNKYSVSLIHDGAMSGTYFLSINIDNGNGLEEVASVPYTNLLINGLDPNKTIISAPTFYGEFTADNCYDFSYRFITQSLR